MGTQRGSKKRKRAKNIDVILPGLDTAVGRVAKSEKDRDRFQVSSGVRTRHELAARSLMVKDLARRLMWPILKARLDGRFSTEKLYTAYRGGDKALEALLNEAKAPRLPRLAKLLGDYLETKEQKRTVEQIETRIRRFILYLGDPTTADFTAQNVERFLNSLKVRNGGKESKRGVSGGTANRYRAVLNGFASWLVRNDYLVKHPIAFKSVEKRQETRHRPPDLSPAEYRSYFAILEKLRPDLVILFKLLVHSGADIGELVGVTATTTKPRKPGLLVRDCYLDRDLPRLRLVRTKTNTPERQVPIPKDIAVSLQAHIELKGLRPGDEVFGGSGDTFGITYEEAAWVHERARISITRPDLKIKSLRHIAAIYWRRQGVDLLTIRDWLGHSTVSQTQVYAEFGPDDAWELPATEGAY
ncbi:MAG TPA: hypothetical protein VF041_08165 [Gemmatimonadaceae bacterium]